MIHFNNENHHFEIADLCDVKRSVADQCISRTNAQGELLGGVIYTNYAPGGSIEMCTASFRYNWINRDLLWVCFHYPFVQLGVKKVFARVRAKDQHALKFDMNLGFEVETKIADVFADDDLIILSMKKEKCRWLKIKPKGIEVGRDGRKS